MNLIQTAKYCNYIYNMLLTFLTHSLLSAPNSCEYYFVGEMVYLAPVTTISVVGQLMETSTLAVIDATVAGARTRPH